MNFERVRTYVRTYVCISNTVTLQDDGGETVFTDSVTIAIMNSIKFPQAVVHTAVASYHMLCVHVCMHVGVCACMRRV